MKPSLVSFLLVVVCAAPSLAGCSHNGPPVVPLSAAPSPEAPVTLVWVGAGEAERLEGGAWKRIPAFDYEFSVVQRRYGDHWESVKSLHRRHPDYDGSAGPRDQTMFFRVDYAEPAADGSVAAKLDASLGVGSGTTDREFRHTTLELRADVSRFAPFNTYRIDQNYGYATGTLDETVTLDKREKDGKLTPWVRNREKARLFGQRAFDHAPSTR